MVQVKNAEQQVLSALQSAKGRGRVLPDEQLQQLNAAIQLLEDEGGVSGALTGQQLLSFSYKTYCIMLLPRNAKDDEKLQQLNK